MYNPEKDSQFNALPLPYHARRAAINDGFTEIAKTPAILALKKREQRQAQEAIATMPTVESSPIANDRQLDRENVVILDDYRDRGVEFARGAVDAVFEGPESGYDQKTA